MLVEDIVRSQLLEKVETLFENMSEHVKFVDIGDDRWQVRIEFDLKELPDIEREALSLLLKFL